MNTVDDREVVPKSTEGSRRTLSTVRSRLTPLPCNLNATDRQILGFTEGNGGNKGAIQPSDETAAEWLGSLRCPLLDLTRFILRDGAPTGFNFAVEFRVMGPSTSVI